MGDAVVESDLFIYVVVAVLVSPFVLYIAIRMWFSHRREQRESLAKADANKAEAESFFTRLSTEGGKAVQCNLVLANGEHAILVDVATLYETRSYRVHAGAGTRVKGVLVGAGASESHDRLRRIDSGTLVLTTRRLVFDGMSENRAIKLSDILSATPLLDAIEVSTQRRGKSMILSVPNPLIWAPMIKHVASGTIDTSGPIRSWRLEKGWTFRSVSGSVVRRGRYLGTTRTAGDHPRAHARGRGRTDASSTSAHKLAA